MAIKPTYEELEQRIKALEKEAARATVAEQALREKERFLPQMIQGNPIPTFVINRDHTITYCNKAFENLIGVSVDQILGSQKWLEAAATARPYMADFIVDQAPEEEMAWYYGRKCRKSKAIEGAYEAEAFFPRMGEKGKWLFITAAPLRDEEGKLVGAIETLQDITENRDTEAALLESEKRLSQMVHGTSIPTFVISADHTMILCNRAFENLTGIRASQIIGTKAQWMAFYSSERPVMADFIVDGASEEDMRQYYGDKCRKSRIIDGAYEVEDFFPDLGSGGKWLFFTAAPLMDDDKKIVGAIETLQDATER
ncbi:MAG: PAS domain-containing protein, partial [Desulfobacterota bacterium]|nr:PAS domain-containing protein [Thermodesulfobacteriota bacterium]